MKTTKKLLSFILAILMLCIPTTVAFAQTTDEAPQVYVINEEEMMEELQSKTDDELSEIGYSTEDIQEIRDFDYFEELSKRAEFDDETLRLYGYTDDEISTLREYVNSDGRTRLTISPNTLTISLGFISRMNGVRATFKLDWEWKRVPIQRNIDCVGAAWRVDKGDKMYFIPYNDEYMTVTYKKINPAAGGPNSASENFKWNGDDFYTKVPILTSFAGSKDYFSYSGTGRFTISVKNTTNERFETLSVAVAYGHYYKTVTIGISASLSATPFSISFTGNSTVDTRQIKRIYNRDFSIFQDYSD